MRLKALATCLLAMLCVQGSTNANAETCVSPISARSGNASATIVELYTSEGCDSCPPADTWFSTLNYSRDGVVPLAFHVDYWDYIGWNDRFAKPVFAQRQRDAVARQVGRTSYTPQVMLDGRDERAWSNPSRFQSRVREVSARTPRANLMVDAKYSESSVEAALLATVALPADRVDAVVFLGVTEDKLTSPVSAGENKGVVLKHDHVVRALIGPLAVDAKDRAQGNFPVRRILALAPDWKRSDLSIVAFVQNSRTGEILQALSTRLCRD